MLQKHSYFCFLDGYSGYHQITIHPEDQNKTMFTCPYGTYAYRWMSFGLCNAPTSFQRCMMSIFSDMIEEIMEVFMDDFSVYGTTFDHCLENLDRVLQRCQEKDLILNWEKFQFMVREGEDWSYWTTSASHQCERNQKLPWPCRILSKVHCKLLLDC